MFYTITRDISRWQSRHGMNTVLLLCQCQIGSSLSIDFCNVFVTRDTTFLHIGNEFILMLKSHGSFLMCQCCQLIFIGIHTMTCCLQCVDTGIGLKYGSSIRRGDTSFHIHMPVFELFACMLYTFMSLIPSSHSLLACSYTDPGPAGRCK